MWIYTIIQRALFLVSYVLNSLEVRNSKAWLYMQNNQEIITMRSTKKHTWRKIITNNYWLFSFMYVFWYFSYKYLILGKLCTKNCFPTACIFGVLENTYFLWTVAQSFCQGHFIKPSSLVWARKVMCISSWEFMAVTWPI